MIWAAFNLALLGVAAAVVVAYVCRIGLLHWRLHQTTVIVLHVAGMGAAFGVGAHAWQRQADLQDVLSLVLAGSWIALSTFNWRGQVPPHWLRRPRDGAE